MKKEVGGALAGAGFKRAGTRWFLAGDDVDVVIAFQDGRYLKTTWINIGIETRSERLGIPGPVVETAIRLRADDLRELSSKVDSPRLEMIMDVADPTDIEYRMLQLKFSIDNVLLPGIEMIRKRSFLSSAGGREFLRSHAIVRHDAGL